MEETTSLKTWAMTLYREHGRLTPEIVREAARPSDSPAHAFVFNTGLETAAESYYLDRAHKLIRQVKVTVVQEAEEAPRRVRFFHAIPGEDDAYVYVTIDDLVRDPDKLGAARTEAVRRLRDAESSVEDLDALAQNTPTSERSREALKSVRAAREALTTV